MANDPKALLKKTLVEMDAKMKAVEAKISKRAKAAKTNLDGLAKLQSALKGVDKED